MIAGVFCVLAPFIPHIDGPPFIGRILIFCGFVHAYRLFSARGAAARLKGAAPVVIALLIGTLILLNDGPHARSLAVMLMIFFVLDGYFKIVASVGGAPVIRNGIPIFRAGLSFFFAIFLAATFPATPIWLLEVFLGVDLISMGVTLFPRVSAARRELDASA
ncbi:hypothetical protein LJ656_13185 [Paraburkholderia sp. MMS20-SJTR3]|uniref:Uncharacterized protein n=1 Tax=Paraburkholderia sejongensis TaxID=2886946 RepID=A0ABS8JUG5_9BURK|nr:hypothetical protein [Paraburkholderia sp. MMS20-SJTR3]MCC8393546.1 hypothetical protein [Paraburkholderia sp. MMS20-SJTR3]